MTINPRRKRDQNMVVYSGGGGGGARLARSPFVKIDQTGTSGYALSFYATKSGRNWLVRSLISGPTLLFNATS